MCAFFQLLRELTPLSEAFIAALFNLCVSLHINHYLSKSPRPDLIFYHYYKVSPSTWANLLLLRRPLAKVFFFTLWAKRKELIMLFWPILDHFWCSVVTLIIWREKIQRNWKRKNWKNTKISKIQSTKKDKKDKKIKKKYKNKKNIIKKN